jgi:hypothetical protein
MIEHTFTGYTQGVAIRTSFAYDENDPYAVHMALIDPEQDEPVLWTFARDTLLEAVRIGQSGDGDVFWFIPEDGSSNDIIVSFYDTATVRYPLNYVSDFIHNCYDLVPLGAESRHLDIDGCIERLLAA